jgi:hypothetical protein
MPRKRKPIRKNTRRARGRRTNRERPTAPYRAGATASARVIPPTGEGARAHATTREDGHQRMFRFRATAPAAPAPAEPGDGPGNPPGTGPAPVERDAS